MKEMLKSKFLILFIVFVLGVSYFNSLNVEKLNNKSLNDNELIINK
ncbi:MAG: hypothetical protein J6K21_02890 [Bacilli bacterium]|nr:hypothetical protein [Bacilli bacterium]